MLWQWAIDTDPPNRNSGTGGPPAVVCKHRHAHHPSYLQSISEPSSRWFGLTCWMRSWSRPRPGSVRSSRDGPPSMTPPTRKVLPPQSIELASSGAVDRKSWLKQQPRQFLTCVLTLRQQLTPCVSLHSYQPVETHAASRHLDCRGSK